MATVLRRLLRRSPAWSPPLPLPAPMAIPPTRHSGTTTPTTGRAWCQNWTFTTNGSLSGGYYFERINTTANPERWEPDHAGERRRHLQREFHRGHGLPGTGAPGCDAANSPYITLSLPSSTRRISKTVNGNKYWFRYNHDGYGEHSDGSNYNGTGIGRLWPIFSGERGIYNIADGIAADCGAHGHDSLGKRFGHDSGAGVGQQSAIRLHSGDADKVDE